MNTINIMVYEYCECYGIKLIILSLWYVLINIFNILLCACNIKFTNILNIIVSTCDPSKLATLVVFHDLANIPKVII